MEKTTLTQAIHASQILLMLQPSFRYTKPAVKLLSVVRSGIDEAVATLVATERSPTRLDNAQKDAEQYIEKVESQLRTLMGHFNVPAVVQGKLPTSIMAKKGTRTDILVKTLEKLVSIRPKPLSLAIFQMMSNNNSTAVAGAWGSHSYIFECCSSYVLDGRIGDSWIESYCNWCYQHYGPEYSIDADLFFEWRGCET